MDAMIIVAIYINYAWEVVHTTNMQIGYDKFLAIGAPIFT